MKAALVLALFVATAGLAVLGSARHPASEPKPWKDARLRRWLSLLAPWSCMAVLAFAYQLSDGSALRIASDYGLYRRLLCTLPLAEQGAIGLALLLLVSVLTARLFAARFSRGALALAAACIVAWAVVFQWLPFHLSAPDYDDFYVVDKLLCSIEPAWDNDKPVLTVYDFLWRIVDGVGATGDPFDRFAVGGWLWVLYQANLVLIVQRLLSGRLGRVIGSRGAAAALCLAVANLGTVVLSTTLDYELAGAVFLLVSFNLFEGILDGAIFRRFPEGAVLGWCGLGLLMQVGSHNQMNIMWLAVLVHAVLALHELRADCPRTTVALLLASVGLVFAVVLGPMENVVTRGRWSAQALTLLAVAILAPLAALVAMARNGRLQRSWKVPTRRDTTVLATLVFAGLAGILWITPNQANPGLPVPLSYGHWDMATNHARYASLLYPFGVAGVGWLAGRSWGRSPRFWAFVILGAAGAAWNLPYAIGFYASPTNGDCAAGTAFRRNLRPYRALEQEVARTGVDGGWYYLPIPRDHGDHYLMRAVRPDVEVHSLCELRGDAPREPGRLLVSRHTLCNLGPGDVAARVPVELSADARGLERSDWEVQIVDTERLSPSRVARWCETYEAEFGPRPASQRGLCPQPTSESRRAARRHEEVIDQPTSSSR